MKLHPIRVLINKYASEDQDPEHKGTERRTDTLVVPSSFDPLFLMAGGLEKGATHTSFL